VGGNSLQEFQQEQQRPPQLKVEVFGLLQHAALTRRTYWPTAVFLNERLAVWPKSGARLRGIFATAGVLRYRAWPVLPENDNPKYR
jgi:hypothetical protein